MRIYIDEAGNFAQPNLPRSLFSLVLAHIVPAAVEAELNYEFLRLRDTWPIKDIEIKGRTLNEAQAAQIINLVLQYDTVVQFVALDVNTHPDSLVAKFKNRQADSVTANITRENHPGPIQHLHQLGEATRGMSNQLFLQTFAMWELIIRTIREATVYYVQRKPEELGEIAWVIDRKNRTLTEMEETWSTLILPFSQDAFGRKPLICLKDEDYSHFDAKYGITNESTGPETLQHIEWLRSIYGSPRDTGKVLTDVKKLLTATFADSHSSLGLQLADMLASILRRALNNRLQSEGWKDFGGLLIRHHNPGEGFIQLGLGGGDTLIGHARKVCQYLDSKAKPMFAKQDTV